MDVRCISVDTAQCNLEFTVWCDTHQKPCIVQATYTAENDNMALITSATLEVLRAIDLDQCKDDAKAFIFDHVCALRERN